MKWWKSKKREQVKDEEPVDILEIFPFIQKILKQLSENRKDVKGASMDLSRLREENELLKMQISLLEKMMNTEL